MGLKTQYDDLNSKHTPTVLTFSAPASPLHAAQKLGSGMTIHALPPELKPVKSAGFYSLIQSNHAKICAFQIIMLRWSIP
jgi:hypothetical protein